MPVVHRHVLNASVVEIEFVTDSSNVVIEILIRSTFPTAVRIFINHAGSGYSSDGEYVLTAPLSITLPKPRRFPNDNTALVSVSPNVRTVA